MAQTQQPHRTLLHMGLDSGGGFTHEQIDAARERDAADVAKLGITATEFWIHLEAADVKDPNVSEKFPTIIKDAKEIFHSQRWDIISIGYGVRGPFELTALFEGLVNAAAELEPTPMMLFAVKPDGDMEALKRTPGALSNSSAQ